MKIILASESYYPMVDGGAVAEHNLALTLAARGHDVHIIAPSDEYKDKKEPDKGTTIHRVASVTTPLLRNKHRFAWLPYKKVEEIIRTIQPDVIHIHNPFPIGKAALKAAKKFGVPIVATNHWLPENMTTFMAKARFMNSINLLVKWNWKFINNFHNKCNFTTAPTQTAIDLMVKNGLKGKYKPVSNGVNMTVFRPDIDSTPLKKRLNLPDKPTALYTGRLSGEKFVDVFVRAIPLVLEKVDAHFIIGGNGRERPNLIALAHSLGLEDKTTFTGFLADEEFPLVYNCADIFVMPSICELQSITTLEALASALPAIAANKYALPELVHHGENGYLFEPFNHRQLADYLIELFLDEKKRKKMGEKGLEIVRQHSLENAVSDYENVYHSVI